MKSYVATCSAYVLSVIPETITVTNAPARQGNYPHTTSKLVSLAGQANAITTRRVTVNGQPAVWTAWQAAWSVSNVSLLPGINRVVIQAFDAADNEVDRSSIDIWFDTGFPGFAEGSYLLEGMVPDVHLRPESAARGTGFNGMDMGPYVPTTASIGGVPVSPTWRADATLTVGGTDMCGYKYRVTGPGFADAWSAEMAGLMPVTALTRKGLTATATVAGHGFANGDVVEIVGADRAAYNGWFTVFAVTPNTFFYTLAKA